MIAHESNFEVTNRHGDAIYATVTWPTQRVARRCPLVILLHGFKGFRNYGCFPMAAQHLADAGMLVVRMDFSQNGMMGTADRVTIPSQFAANTITRELDDVSDVLDYVRASSDTAASRMNELWDSALYLVGHSRGGGIAQVAGVELDAQKVVVWNSVGEWERWTPRQRSAWLASGAVEVENTRTGQKLQMNSTYIQDIEANQERLSLVTACGKLSHRLLLVHAEHDLTVPLKEVKNLLLRANGNASLHIVTNTTHTFGMTHPLDHVTPAFVEVLEHTKVFLRNPPKATP